MAAKTAAPAAPVKKEFVPQAFDALGTEAAALLFIDLKKDWVPTVQNDTVKWELKGTAGVKNTVKVERADNKLNGSIELRLPTTSAWALEPVLSADTKRKVKVAVAQANKLVPGLKTTVTVEALLDKQKADLKLAFDYKRAGIAYSALFSLPFAGFVPTVAEEASAKNSLVVGYVPAEAHQLSAGTEVDYLLAKSYLKSWNTFVQYRNVSAPATAWTAGAYSRQTNVEEKGADGKTTTKKTKNLAGLLIHQKYAKFIGNNAEVAFQLEYDLQKAKDNTTVTAAVAFDAVPNGRVHVRVNTLNIANASFTQKLSDNASLKLGAEISGEAASVTKGFLELAFTD